jgi:hypothetical protein
MLVIGTTGSGSEPSTVSPDGSAPDEVERMTGNETGMKIKVRLTGIGSGKFTDWRAGAVPDSTMNSTSVVPSSRALTR